ncbi:restriction endonuclease, SacI family, partial [Pseudomonas sp. HMWF021]|uniref:restriction endonuclease, SacI family n=1 Tax=Pseudomonas sp. HMWF021 TaxID=2056857 RepID=UPI000D3D5A48
RRVEFLSQTNVDHAQAKRVLTAAIQVAKQESYTPKHRKSKDLEAVMLGRHLTYRYILFTNLLAKATNSKVNGIALQAGAPIVGAYDARSLCHNVVVSFDRDPEKLAGKLGRSNEPFLNKPARYPTLSTNNAVRRGYDASILTKCIDILSSLRNSEDALAALEDVVYYTMMRESLVAEAIPLDGDAAIHEVLTKFAEMALTSSNEGESCAIIGGIAFWFLVQSDGRPCTVKVHPVNQAGTSSLEVLDIDISIAGQGLVHSIEVKDKPFTQNDVDHAARKVQAAGLDRFLFLCGPQAGQLPTGSQLIDLVEVVALRGVKVSFVDVRQFFSVALGLAVRELDAVEVWEQVVTIMDEARVKDATRIHIISCAEDAGLVSRS